ncbi:transcriptional repressor [bacterium]|nr:transcriptional repressor [bacterium]
MTAADRQRRLAQFHQAHRTARLPVTTQRLAVFAAILEREDHPTADQVYEQVRTRLPRIARMTVYRILGAFARLGLITKTCHPGSAARFDPKIHRHHHLVCRDCDGIIDLEAARLNRVPRPDVRRYGFQIED